MNLENIFVLCCLGIEGKCKGRAWEIGLVLDVLLKKNFIICFLSVQRDQFVLYKHGSLRMFSRILNIKLEHIYVDI